MIKLKNEIKDYRISTSGMKVQYSDDGCLTIQASGISEDGGKRFFLEISFTCVAESCCKTLNFYESKYEAFVITPDADETRTRVSGFYEVIDSEYLKEAVKEYDPMKRLNLKHYLVTGGDGYCEIVASSHAISKSPERKG